MPVEYAPEWQSDREIQQPARSITAPQNAQLPDGGGQPVTFVTRNARTALGATDNYFTLAGGRGVRDFCAVTEIARFNVTFDFWSARLARWAPAPAINQ